MNIQEFRQQYPDYNDISNTDLAQKLHAKNYSDMPFEDFAFRFGVSTVPKRGIVGETGTALARGFLELGQAPILAAEKLFTQEPEKYRLIGTPWAPISILPTAEQQVAAKKKFQAVRGRMKAAKQKIPQTWEGVSGWAINTLGEGAPYLAAAISSGGTIGMMGPITLGFTMGGKQAYDKAIADGASEDRAMQEYMLGGLAEAALETWGVSRLLKFKTAGKGSLKLMVKNLKGRLWKKAGGNLKNITGNMVKSALVEGLEEASQSGANLAISALPSGSELPRKADGSVDYKAMVKQIGMEGAGGALLGAVVPAGMNIPAGIVIAADPGVQKIEQAARTIQADDRLSPYEKARGINQLREMLPEDYQPTVEPAVEGQQIINVYQDADGNNYNEDEVTVKEVEGNRVPVAPNGDPVVINPELSGTAIETGQPADPFHIPKSVQKVIDVVDKFEKNLSEHEVKRSEETKETKARMASKMLAADEVLRAEIAAGTDPEIAMNRAKKTMKGYARTMFPEFQELFTVEDMKIMRRAMAESTLTTTQKLDIDKVFLDIAGNILPHPSSIRAFDDFFGTNITKIGKNKPKTWKQKMWRVLQEPGRFLVNILGSIDVSAAGIQGFPFILAHPWQGIKATVKGYRGISEKYVRLQNILIKTHPHYNRIKAAGLPITEMGSETNAEEEFRGSLAHKIPFIGKLVKASGRIHTSTLNGMRFNQACRVLDAWGENTSYAKEQEMMHHLANLTGRGKGNPKGWFEEHMRVWSAAFWTPRMARATVASPFDFISKPHIRKEAAHDLVQGIAIMAGLTFLTSLIRGIDVEDDPRSSDFGKSKIGETRFPMWGRWGPYIVFLSRIISGEVKSTSTGEIIKADRGELFTRFLRGKLNPIAGVGVDIGYGETFLGEKLRFDDPEFMTKYIREHVTPLFVQDVTDAIRFQGLDNLNPLMVGIGAHTGMQTYETDARKQANELKNTYAHEYYGKDWAQLGSAAQQMIRARQPLIQQYEEDAYRERENFEWRGKQDQREYEAGRKVIKGLDKDVRRMWDNAAAKIPQLKQTVRYRGSYWKMNLERYEQYQKNLKPELEKALRRLKSMPNWDMLDTRMQRAAIETVTGEVVKYVRLQLINKINFADLEQWEVGQNEQRK